MRGADLRQGTREERLEKGVIPTKIEGIERSRD